MQAIQLLEDIEGTEPGPSSIPTSPLESSHILSTTPALFPEQSNLLSGQTGIMPPPVLHDEYGQLADDFLSRLAIFERQPIDSPHPPSFGMSHATAEDSLPEAGGRLQNTSASLLPFDMAPLQRELLGSQSRMSRFSQVAEDNPLQEAVNEIRRVDVDVEPGYQEYMDQGWELFKQMRENGDLN